MSGGANGPAILDGTAYIYPSETLASLRNRLLVLLEFPDPLLDPDGETKSLSFLRDRVLTNCGFFDPLTYDTQTKTLATLREIVVRQLGFYYVAGGNPQGLDTLVNKWIDEAQETVFRMAELDKTGVSFPTAMSADGTPTSIDYVPVLTLALAKAKSHYGQPDAKSYFDLLNKYLTDRAAARPPNIVDQVNGFINEAQQMVFRMVEMDKGGLAFPAQMTADNDTTSIDYIPVLAMATALAKGHFKQADAKAYADELVKYLRDRTIRRPPNIVDLATEWLKLAQKQLYRRYGILRSFRWFRVSVSQGNRFYDLPSISSGVNTTISFTNGTPALISRTSGSWLDDGFKAGMKIKAGGSSIGANNGVQWTIASLTGTVITLAGGDTVTTVGAGDSVSITTVNYITLDERTIEEAWIVDNTTWIPMKAGIKPAEFTLTNQTLPMRYQMREYFEIWPEPDKAYTVWIYGRFGLLPFEADSDVTTLDPDLILQQALVWGKASRKMPDARVVARDFELMLGQLNAGNFDGLRFIPSRDRDLPPPLPYPSVTFPRT